MQLSLFLTTFALLAVAVNAEQSVFAIGHGSKPRRSNGHGWRLFSGSKRVAHDPRLMNAAGVDSIEFENLHKTMSSDDFSRIYESAAECVNDRNVWTFESLSKCLRSIPFSPQVRDLAVDSIRKSVPFYVFKSLAKKVVNPDLPVQVDIDDALAAVANKTFSTDVDMQDALTGIFFGLRDAHTYYYKGEPYNRCAFHLPFRLTHGTDKKGLYRAAIVRVPDLEAQYTAAYGADAFDFGRFGPANDAEGAVLNTINGADAIKVLSNFARDKVSVSKDFNARYNLAVDGYGNGLGYYVYRESKRYPIPEKEISFNFTSPKTGKAETATLAWFGVCKNATKPANASESSSYSLYSTEPTGTTESAPKRSLEMIKMASEWREHPAALSDRITLETRAKEALLGKRSSATEAGTDPRAAYGSYTSPSSIVSSWTRNGNVKAEPKPDIYFEILEGEPPVGYLRITSFSPDDMSAFIGTVTKALAAFAEAKAEHMIVDVRANGGGDICAGYVTANLLFGAKPTGIYDVLKTDLSSRMGRLGTALQRDDPSSITSCGGDPEGAGYYTPCVWRDVETGDAFVNDDWLSSGPTVTQNGDKVPHSTRVREDCTETFATYVPPTSAGNLTLPRHNLLVSDGLCGSTCAVFSSSAILRGSAMSLFMGGNSDDIWPATGPAKIPQFFSFPGGEVVNTEFLIDNAKRYNITDPDTVALVPKALPNKGAVFRWAVREIYPWGFEGEGMTSDLPLEFVLVRADFHLPYGTKGSLDDNHAKEAARMMVTKQCSARVQGPKCGDGSSTTMSCVGGKWLDDKCIPSSCKTGEALVINQLDKDGLEMKDSPSVTCEACKPGTFSDGESTVCEKCPFALPKGATWDNNAENGLCQISSAGDNGNGNDNKDGDKKKGVFKTTSQAALAIGGAAVGGALIAAAIVFVTVGKSRKSSLSYEAMD